MSRWAWWWAVLVAGVPAGLVARAAEHRPNVLFIAVDDLNDWVGCLGGHPQARTPHIDALAARGVNFTRAYCASPVCNPSRSALLTGLHSSSSGVYANGIDRGRSRCRDVVPLNTHFHDQGYFVAGAGKIYHGDHDRWGTWDDYATSPVGAPPPGAGENPGVGGIHFAPIDGDDDALEDFHTVAYCIAQMQHKHDKPLFLACGLHKPHMPWNVPRKYYDLFPLESIELPRVLATDLDDVPPAGVALARAEGDHQRILESGRWKEAVRGYLAAGAFCDAMIGRLLAGLDASPIRDDTIVVFWGDHGWHLGEKQHWRKFALWEEATRAPLVFVVPGLTRPRSTCARTVDFMGIYPTLCDLCGLATPAHVQGVSLRPLLADPDAPWDRPALTTHGHMNHAVRSEAWRYIRYANGDEELYDERADPLEWRNLAGDPGLAAVKADLARWLPTENVAPVTATRRLRAASGSPATGQRGRPAETIEP